MVDPTKATNFNRTDYELQEFLLFCITVAGKTASVISYKMDWYLKGARDLKMLPFDFIKWYTKDLDFETLQMHIRVHALGDWKKKLPLAYKQLIEANLDLRTCTLDELEAIHGIGPKTARYFLLHSRPGLRIACLDTHVLRWLREQGYKAPKTTPSGKRYKTLEALFIAEADVRGKSINDLDLEIWNSGSARSGANSGVVYVDNQAYAA